MRTAGGADGASVYHVAAVDEPLDAVVEVPGSKSIANRALVCATLAPGASILTNTPAGDDTAAMIDCIGLLGAGVARDVSDPSSVTVHGTGGLLRPGPMTLHSRLAGTTARFVTALCALGSGHYEVDGDDPLRARPMGDLHDALVQLGVTVEPTGGWGRLPVRIAGLGTARPARTARPRTDAPERGCTVTMAGDVSSQFVSALMLIAPYLPGGLTIRLTTALVSRPYVAVTAAVMRAFSGPDVEIGEHHISVAAGSYSPTRYAIEPDASSASYPLAAAAICGGTVTVAGLGRDAVQGDAAFADVLAQMGCDVDRGATHTSVRRSRDLRGLTIDMTDLSDLVPTLAVVAPFASTATEITGVGFIRAKESDRLGDLVGELGHCGIDATELPDGIRIRPGTGRGAAIDTHHDHRLAMAFGILGLRLGGMRIHDPDVVTKSWPGFWTAIDAMARPR